MILEIAKKYNRALVDAINHDGFEFAGYLAFLGLLAIFPFMVFMFAIVGFLGNLRIGQEFVIELGKLLPEGVLEGLMPRLNEILSGPPQGILTLAIVGTIWTASSIFEGIRTCLNRAFHVKNPPSYIFRRLMSFIEFIITTLVVITITFMLTIAPEFYAMILKKFELLGKVSVGFTDQFQLLRFSVTALIVFLLVITSYVLIPNINLRFKEVLIGTVTVMFGWVLAGAAYSYYLLTFHQVNLVYGSLAGIIATLLFFYIMAFIYIFGAEVNYQFLKKAN